MYVHNRGYMRKSLHMAMQDGLRVAMVVPWGRNCGGEIKSVVTGSEGEDRYVEYISIRTL